MSEIHGAVGSYVVNALDPQEKEEFEAHLSTCETCRREVVEFSETAAHLGSLVETAPPPELRASVLAAIREVRPLPPRVAETAPDRDDVGPGPITAAPRRAAAPVVDELALRRQRRTNRLLSLAVAAAMVLALSLGGWVVNLVQDRQAQVAEAGLLTELMTAPDRQTYNKTLNGAATTFVVSKSLNKAVMLATDVPAPGADKTYQLWTVKGTVAAPDTTFGGGKNQQTWLSGDVHEADGIAVSLEKSGGATVPTTVLTQVLFKA